MVFSVYIYEMATNYSFHAITFPKYSDESTFFKSVLKIKEQKQEEEKDIQWNCKTASLFNSRWLTT